MTGYKWEPVFRFTPANGIRSYMRLDDAFSDAQGPTRIDLDYLLDQDRRETVGRRRSGLYHGFRPTVRFRFELATTEDQANFATICNRLKAPKLWTVALSLDAGVVFRDVTMTRNGGPDPLGGSTRVGARWELTVEAEDLLPEIPNQTAHDEAIERLMDGGLEQWVTANNLQAWSETVGATGFFAQESSIVRSGTYSARMLKTASEELILSQSGLQLLPARRYRLSGAVRSASAVAQALRFVVIKLGGAVLYLNSSGSWQSGSVACIETDGASGAWSVGSLEFLADPSFTDSNTYSVYCRYPAANGINVDVYWDDLSLVGPVRPDGISAW